MSESATHAAIEAVARNSYGRLIAYLAARSWRGTRLILLGVFFGLAAAVAATRFFASQFFGVTPTDPLTFAIVVLYCSATT